MDRRCIHGFVHGWFFDSLHKLWWKRYAKTLLVLVVPWLQQRFSERRQPWFKEVHRPWRQHPEVPRTIRSFCRWRLQNHSAYFRTFPRFAIVVPFWAKSTLNGGEPWVEQVLCPPCMSLPAKMLAMVVWWGAFNSLGWVSMSYSYENQ